MGSGFGWAALGGNLAIHRYSLVYATVPTRWRPHSGIPRRAARRNFVKPRVGLERTKCSAEYFDSVEASLVLLSDKRLETGTIMEEPHRFPGPSRLARPWISGYWNLFSASKNDTR